MTSIATSSLATPATLAAMSTAMLGTWVDTHNLTLPSLSWAVQLIGSIVAWARKGARYSARMVLVTALASLATPALPDE